MNKISFKKLTPALMAFITSGSIVAVSSGAIVSASTTTNSTQQVFEKPSVATTNATPSVVSQTSIANDAIAMTESDGNITFSVEQSQLAKERIALMLKVTPSLAFSQTGTMISTLTDNELVAKYDLSTDQLATIKLILKNFNRGFNDATSPIQYMAKFSGGNLYLSYREVVGILSTVNDVGPIALAAAVSAAASVVPAIGTIIGGFVGLFGADAIILVMSDAVLNKKGIRIGVSGISAVKY